MLKTYFLLLVLLASKVVAETADDDSLTYAAIQKRITPIGQVAITNHIAANNLTTKPNLQRSGDEIYDSVCSLCHSSGAVGAPKFGQRTAWAPRAKKGFKLLLEHALQGYNFMPTRGTCLDCSDAEISAAILYMLNVSLK